MRYATLKARAERYARMAMDEPDARAVGAVPAGEDGRAVAVLVDLNDAGDEVVLAYNEYDQLVTDSADPADFDFSDVAAVA